MKRVTLVFTYGSKNVRTPVQYHSIRSEFTAFVFFALSLFVLEFTTFQLLLFQDFLPSDYRAAR